MKTKRLLSVISALCLALTICLPCFSALAGDTYTVNIYDTLNDDQLAFALKVPKGKSLQEYLDEMDEAERANYEFPETAAKDGRAYRFLGYAISKDSPDDLLYLDDIITYAEIYTKWEDIGAFIDSVYLTVQPLVCGETVTMQDYWFRQSPKPVVTIEPGNAYIFDSTHGTDKDYFWWADENSNLITGTFKGGDIIYASVDLIRMDGYAFTSETEAYINGELALIDDCSEYYIRARAAVPVEHDWDDGTENADGSITYTCAQCGEQKTETLPSLGSEAPTATAAAAAGTTDSEKKSPATGADKVLWAAMLAAGAGCAVITACKKKKEQ